MGAAGIFQIMPNTAKELGIDEMEDPKNSIKGGIKYMEWLVRQFDVQIEFRQRIRFALAAFNVGLGHVKDARRLAKSLGLDPDRWFQNVEVALLKLQDRRYYKRAKHGYCRGSEPVKYVSEIQSRYDAYVKIIP
jgi:membrane-bound lytic murein transglycosylase F